MDRGAPSDVELLDMAREVLAVCSDRSLKDIIEDLTMTKSSEMTINRIFDGQFLRALTPPPLAPVPPSSPPAPTTPMTENTVVLLSSSDDGDSEIDDFLRLMSRASASIAKARPPTAIAKQPERQAYGRDSTGDDTFEEQDSVIIDLHSTPTRKTRPLRGKFQLVSPKDAFSEWDYELTSLPTNGQDSPTVIFSSPISSTTDGMFISDSGRARFHSNNGFDVLDESSAATNPLLRRLSSTLLDHDNFSVSAPASPPSVLMHRSRKGSPTARDLLPSIPIRMDLGLDDDRYSGELGDLERRATVSLIAPPKEMGKWDHLVDMNLSPPREFPDDSDDGNMDELLSEIGLSGSSSSKSFGKTKATSIQKGKKRATVPMAVSLEDWDDGADATKTLLRDSQGPEDSIPLEEEIVKRARRRPKKAKVDVQEDDSGSQGDSGPTEAQLRKAEREEQKLAKEVERQAKKAAREQETQRKKGLKEQEKANKEEERQAELKAARELRLANRLTTKYDVAKEMIVCVEESLYKSKFGLALQDYLASIDCQVKTVPVAGGEGITRRAISGNDLDGACDPVAVKGVAFWQRIVAKSYDEDLDIFVPHAEKDIELESFVLICMAANELANKIRLGELRGHLAVVQRDMKLRKNKERLKKSSQPQHRALPLKEDRSQRQRVIFLIMGLENFFRELRKVATRKFHHAVLATMGTAQDLSSNTNVMEEEPSIDQETIEQEMLYLQLEQDCLIIRSNDDDESAMAIVSLTEQIGLRPYTAVRRPGLNVCVDGIKSGKNPQDTWVKSLQEIHMVTNLTAKSIVQEYPSLKSLYEGYRQSANVYEAQMMLENIPVIGRRSYVGKALSRRIYDVFMSDDPNKAVS
ncbi:hypothetical protein BGZ58_005391 [Dissophora ornata]|nr:hypothetical protein BGZ58_005391 [Dissophora ornata]